MNKTLLALLVSTAAITLTACGPDRQSATLPPPGTYAKTTSTTDASGTTITQQDRTNVTVDEYGNKTAVVQSKTTKDPRGLFNKTSSSSTEVIRER